MPILRQTRRAVLASSVCVQVVRKNLRVRLGDIVSVHQCPDVKYGKVRSSAAISGLEPSCSCGAGAADGLVTGGSHLLASHACAEGGLSRRGSIAAAACPPPLPPATSFAEHAPNAAPAAAAPHLLLSSLLHAAHPRAAI